MPTEIMIALALGILLCLSFFAMSSAQREEEEGMSDMLQMPTDRHNIQTTPALYEEACYWIITRECEVVPHPTDPEASVIVTPKGNRIWVDNYILDRVREQQTLMAEAKKGTDL